MLGLSIWKLAIIGGIVMLLFGKGKISGMMGDLAQGIKSFKKGMAEDDSAKALDQKAETVAAPMKEKATAEPAGTNLKRRSTRRTEVTLPPSRLRTSTSPLRSERTSSATVGTTPSTAALHLRLR